MAVGARPGRALSPMAPAQDRSGGRREGAGAGAVTYGAGLLRRCPPRDLWALAAALAAPLAAAAVLLPFRASWSNTNAAVLLVVVVAAVAAAGNRLAGALTAVGAAVWFDLFFTLPYYRLTIRSSDDLTAAVLLLVTGLAVSQLAARARRLKVVAVTGEGYLESMHGTACARAGVPVTGGGSRVRGRPAGGPAGPAGVAVRVRVAAQPSAAAGGRRQHRRRRQCPGC